LKFAWQPADFSRGGELCYFRDRCGRNNGDERAGFEQRRDFRSCDSAGAYDQAGAICEFDEDR
jgi:hypothetical protein